MTEANAGSLPIQMILISFLMILPHMCPHCKLVPVQYREYKNCLLEFQGHRGFQIWDFQKD